MQELGGEREGSMFPQRGCISRSIQYVPVDEQKYP